MISIFFSSQKKTSKFFSVVIVVDNFWISFVIVVFVDFSTTKIMDNKSFVPDNIPADLDKSWHIPRPTLARSSNSSEDLTSSKNSTQSARSGSLLLTAANLAQIHQQYESSQPEGSDKLSTRDQNIQYYLRQANPNDPMGILPVTLGEKKSVEQDNVSIASSMHFTVVNVSTSRKPPQRSFCRKHQLTILVLTMSVLFTIGILTAILLLEMRAKNQRY